MNVGSHHVGSLTSWFFCRWVAGSLKPILNALMIEAGAKILSSSIKVDIMITFHSVISSEYLIISYLRQVLPLGANS